MPSSSNPRPVYRMKLTEFWLAALALVTFTEHVYSQDPGQIPRNVEVQYPEPVTLTDSDIERFISALNDLRAMNIQPTNNGDSDPTGMIDLQSVTQANTGAQAILDQHGFDPSSFQRVGYSIMMAYTAAEMEYAGAEIEASRAQLESLKGLLPPEQYAMIEQKVLAAQKVLLDQPQGNIERVKPYKARINAATR